MMLTPPEAVWLDAAGAAARASVSSATILRAARRGHLRGYKLGAGRKIWRFRPADIDDWIMAGATPEPFMPASSSSRTSTIPEHRQPNTLVEAPPRRRLPVPGGGLAEEG
jgi:excisionase family DNA binding protein